MTYREIWHWLFTSFFFHLTRTTVVGRFKCYGRLNGAWEKGRCHIFHLIHSTGSVGTECMCVCVLYELVKAKVVITASHSYDPTVNERLVFQVRYIISILTIFQVFSVRLQHRLPSTPPVLTTPSRAMSTLRHPITYPPIVTRVLVWDRLNADVGC